VLPLAVRPAVVVGKHLGAGDPGHAGHAAGRRGYGGGGPSSAASSPAVTFLEGDEAGHYTTLPPDITLADVIDLDDRDPRDRR
jgi:hypothetical protein